MISHIKTLISSEGEQWGRDENYPDICILSHLQMSELTPVTNPVPQVDYPIYTWVIT